MKQYFITSLYTEGTQTAIQQDHAGKELFKNVLKNPNSEEYDIFIDYINNHKTTVALGVGQPTELLKIYSYIMHHKDSLKIPVGLFQEDSLNKTATCLSFVATEKLCVNIQYVISNMLKDFKVKNLYELDQLKSKLTESESFKFTCPVSGVIVVTKNVNNKLRFDVSYEESAIVEMQNSNLMAIDLENKDVLESLYKQYNPEDACFFLGETKKETVDESELKSFSYSVEELNFLLMIKSLRLK